MTITVFCPRCRARHDFPDAMRGRLVRCSMLSCKEPFKVIPAGDLPQREPTPDREPPSDREPSKRSSDRETSKPARSPRVATVTGAMVPRADLAEPATVTPPVGKLVAPAPVYDWRTDVPPPLSSSPPVGKRSVPPPPRPLLTGGYGDDRPGPGRGFVMAGLVLLIGLFLVVGVGFVVRTFAQNEDKMRLSAESDSRAGKHRAASGTYEALVAKFPRSSRVAEYKTLAEFESALALIHATPADPAGALPAIRDTLAIHGNEPVLRSRELATPLFKLVDDLIANGELALNDPEALAALPKRIEDATAGLELLVAHLALGGTADAQRARLDRLVRDAALAVSERTEVQRWLTRLKTPTPQLVAEARTWLRDHPGRRSEELAAVLSRAENGFADRVRFVGGARPPKRMPADGSPPSFLVEPALASVLAPSDAVVFARARGLLMALDAAGGRLRWVVRVGLEGNELPTPLPAITGSPASVAVTFQEPPGVARVASATGEILWYQPLPATPQEAAVVCGPRLAVPTNDPMGVVELFEFTRGDRVGSIICEQRLGPGLAADGSLLAVSLASQFVAMFDLAPSDAAGSLLPPTLKGLLRTGHVEGSLRHEPLLLPPMSGSDGPRTLLLGESDGAKATRYRAYRLEDGNSKLGSSGDVRLNGWASAAPWSDGERVVAITDAAALGLFGVNRSGTVDPPLFPLVPPVPPLAENVAPGTRGLVAAVTASDLWLLADGQLGRYRLGLDRRLGLKLAETSPRLRVGTPMHAAQVSSDRQTITLVTQRIPAGDIAATALDANAGRPRWTRALGLKLAADPLEWAGGLLLLEATGRLIDVSPADIPAGPWPSGGKQVAPAIANAARSVLLTSADGKLAVALTQKATENELHLVVRTLRQGEAVAERTVPLPAGLSGTPALGPDAIILPLASGVLCRLPLDPSSLRELGPNWRAAGSAADAVGHAVALPGGYAVSDGGRNLIRVNWPAPGRYDLDTARPVTVPRGITQPPLVTPAGLLVADAGANVSLVDAASWQIVRRWRAAGSPRAITAPMVVANGRAMVTVDGNRLLLLDPNRDIIAWEYVAPNPLVAPPSFVNGCWLLADAQGFFSALDFATGKPLAAPWQHPASVTGTFSLRSAGAGRLFAPLSDGSVALIPLSHLLPEGTAR